MKFGYRLETFNFLFIYLYKVHFILRIEDFLYIVENKTILLITLKSISKMKLIKKKMKVIDSEPFFYLLFQ